MILGEFRAGAPRVQANLFCPSLSIRASLVLGVDTGRGASVISTGDLPRSAVPGFPLDDVMHVGFEGTVTQAIRRRALLSFDDESGAIWLEEVDIIVFDGAAGESRLGRDVLNRWLMVYDPPGDQLMCEPAVRS